MKLGNILEFMIQAAKIEMLSKELDFTVRNGYYSIVYNELSFGDMTLMYGIHQAAVSTINGDRPEKGGFSSQNLDLTIKTTNSTDG